MRQVRELADIADRLPNSGAFAGRPPKRAAQDMEAGGAAASPDVSVKHRRIELNELPWQVGNEECDDGQGVGKIREYSVPESIKFEAEGRRKDIDFLIETVNDIEFNTARAYLDEWDRKRSSFTSVQGPVTVYYGLIRGTKIKAAVVQTNQGSRGQTGAANITGILVGLLKPKAVLLVGVCFGTPAIVLNEKENRKLRMGDVLVGSKLIQYDHGAERDGKEDLRAPPYALPETVTMHLRQCAASWNKANTCRLIDDSEAAKKMMEEEGIPRNAAQAYVGELLCGSKLIDKFEFQSHVVDLARKERGAKPLGGEMEGYGAYEAQTWLREVPCIVIKAICDWGITKTKVFQGVAADAAFNFLADNANSLSQAIQNRMKLDAPDEFNPLDDPFDLESQSDTCAMLEASRALHEAVQEIGTIKASDEYKSAEQVFKEKERDMKKAKAARDAMLKNANDKEKKAKEDFEVALRDDIITNRFTFDGLTMTREIKAKALSFTRSFALKHVHPDQVNEMVRTHYLDNSYTAYKLKNPRSAETELEENSPDCD